MNHIVTLFTHVIVTKNLVTGLHVSLCLFSAIKHNYYIYAELIIHSCLVTRLSRL